MVLVPVCLNGRCCYSGCVGIASHYVNKDKGDESLLLLAFRRYVVSVIFLKYSKEIRLSSSCLGIRNTPSDVCCDGTKHQVQFEWRQYVKCKSTWFEFWNISMILANVWLRNVMVRKLMNSFINSCSLTFSFNCFEVWLALFFCFFLHSFSFYNNQ